MESEAGAAAPIQADAVPECSPVAMERDIEAAHLPVETQPEVRILAMEPEAVAAQCRDHNGGRLRLGLNIGTTTEGPFPDSPAAAEGRGHGVDEAKTGVLNAQAQVAVSQQLTNVAGVAGAPNVKEKRKRNKKKKERKKEESEIDAGEEVPAGTEPEFRLPVYNGLPASGALTAAETGDAYTMCFDGTGNQTEPTSSGSMSPAPIGGSFTSSLLSTSAAGKHSPGSVCPGGMENESAGDPVQAAKVDD